MSGPASVVEWKRPGAREAAVEMVRASITASDLALAFEASAVVLALMSRILGPEEGVTARDLAVAAVDEMLDQMDGGEPPNVQELLGRLSAG